MPAAPTIAPKFTEINQDKTSDSFLLAENYLAYANFAGLPSITVPLNLKEGFPFGANITGRAFEEQRVLDIALAVETITGMKNLSVKKEK